MAVTNTPRLGLPQWGAGTDPHPARSGWNTILDTLDDKVALVFPSGAIADRPTGGAFGRFFLATDQGTDGRLYYDGGNGWIELNTNGGGGAGLPIVIEGTATEGTSNRSARADHTHRLPLATATNHGAMASQWAELLDNVGVGNTADSLVKRTSTGTVRGSNPVHAQDLVPRQWFLDETEMLRTASGGINGTANTLVKRGSDMNFLVPSPVSANHPATKAYVDGKNWSANDITSGTLSYYRVDGSRHAYYTAWGGSGSIRAVHVTSEGEFCYYSSTIRHKINIVPYARSIEDLLGPEPVEFDRLNPYTGRPTGYHDQGFIAEHAGKWMPELIQWGEDEQGHQQIDGWDYQGMITGHQKLHRWEADEIATLKAENTALKDRLAAIEAHLGIGEG